MGSRTLLLLGLAMALVVLISSEVAARDLVETSNTITTIPKATKMDGFDESKVPRSRPSRIPGLPRSAPPFGCPKGCCAQVYLACLECC